MNMNIIYDDGIKKMYDIGIKDAFNRKCYVQTFEGKFCGCGVYDDKYYNRQKKKLEAAGFKNVIPQRHFEIIDLTEKTINKIKQYFEVPEFYITSKWNVWN